MALNLALGLGARGSNATWFNAPAHLGSAAVADFANWRFAATTVSLGNIATATAAELAVKRLATFDEFFAYTAASTTTRYYSGADGVLKNDLAANAPRRDYRNSKQQFRLEDARTNLTTYSQDRANAAWTKLGGAATISGVAPDGTSTANLFTEDAAAGVPHGTYSASITIVSGTTYTVSAFVKAGTQRYISLRGPSAAAGLAWITFDTQTQAINANAGVTSSGYVALANGWYRIWLTCVANTTSTFAVVSGSNVSTAPGLAVSAGAFYTGTSQTWWCWGVQVEAGAFVSDYIPTTSASVTRAIETARFSPLLEAIMQRSAASLVVRGKLDANTAAQRLIGFQSGGGAPILTQANIKRVDSNNAAVTISTASDAAFGFNEAFGAAFGFDGAGRSVALGATVAVDANQPGTRTEIYLARQGGATTNFGFGVYDFIALYPTRLSDAALQTAAVPA